MKYYISDLHFGHHNAIRFDNRPFQSVEEMNEAIISNWNNAVKKGDEVYILGDVFWKNEDAGKMLRRLNGMKFLIKGNHDRINEDMKKHYRKISDYMEINDGGIRVILSHFPIAHWNGQYRGAVHLYGHVHSQFDSETFEYYKEYCISKMIPFKAFNVGCMRSYMGYTPRTLKHIMDAH